MPTSVSLARHQERRQAHGKHREGKGRTKVTTKNTFRESMAARNRADQFEEMIEAVFGGSGWYRQKWRAYRTKDGRTAADICRAVQRSLVLCSNEIAMMADEPPGTVGAVARALLSFYENE